MKQPFNSPEQDTPVTEQFKETIADCGKKTLMDTPTIADHIGRHMNLAFGYAKELVNENTRLRAQLYRLPILEQENAQLKADLSAANQRIAAQAQVIANEPKEPVYDSNWLDSVLMDYANKKYALFGDNHIVAVANLGSWAELDPKTSATIIVAALAKHLNPMFEADETVFAIIPSVDGYTWNDVYPKDATSSHIFTHIDALKKAIDILNQVSPDVLKNYLT